MRCVNCCRSLLIAGLLVGLCASSASAQKNKGGGGTNPPPPTNLPPVTYEVEFQPVEGLGYEGVLGVTGDGRVLVQVLANQLSTQIPTAYERTVALINPDGSVHYPELEATAAEWDFAGPCKVNRYGLIAGMGVKNGDGELRVFAYLPPADGSPAVVFEDIVLSNGEYGYADDVTDNGLVLIQAYDEATNEKQGSWVWSPMTGDTIPVGSWGAGDVYFNILTGDGRLYGNTSVNGQTGAYFRSDIFSDAPTSFVQVRDASDTGFAIGLTSELVKKGGQRKPVYTITVYDAAGSPAFTNSFNWGDLCNLCAVGEEVIGGQPVLAATLYNNGPFRFWVRIPGYDTFAVTDLMSATELNDWQALKIGDDANATRGGSSSYFELMTPFVSVSGAPGFVGEAFRTDPSYMGIYRVTPCPLN